LKVDDDRVLGRILDVREEMYRPEKYLMKSVIICALYMDF
jgi:hypothetical protein